MPICVYVLQGIVEDVVMRNINTLTHNRKSIL